MSEVETIIHDSAHHSLAGICLCQTYALMHIVHMCGLSGIVHLLLHLFLKLEILEQLE